MAKSAAGKAAAQRSPGEEIARDNTPESDVVEHLQRQVANAFVLYANYKHYHWQTFGPLFRDMHLLFDEMAEQVLTTAAEFAERIRMIGPDIECIQLRQMQDKASVHSTIASQSMREMIEEGDANLMGVIK